ncbi:DUF349 domain-containing protein [Ideonella sp. A 288]|uniref:DUF349 domain-containing protein n=1 Tax=Ideonella sp. A 288 TaxID=1962181 RepID=UPI000B4B1006|nr:DUF349 domain-containing protein [Ideonella sp. A 288]
MLSWLFKKRGDPRATKAAPAANPATLRAAAEAEAAAQAARKAADKAATKAQQAEEARAAWAPRLQAAAGDDTALLKVATDAPVLEIRLAAVEALVGEAALKQAEREFRSHDRRIHRVAKQRLEAAVAQREARTQAQALIEAAEVLGRETPMPVNRVVTLDHDWQALAAADLEPGQRARFADLRARLDTVMQDQGEQQQRLQRWTAEARTRLDALQQAMAAAAAEGHASDLAAPIEAAQALRAQRPEAAGSAAATAALDAALAASLQGASELAERLSWLDALAERVAAAAATTPAVSAPTATPEPVATAAPDDAPPDVAPASGPAADTASVDAVPADTRAEVPAPAEALGAAEGPAETGEGAAPAHVVAALDESAAGTSGDAPVANAAADPVDPAPAAVATSATASATTPASVPAAEPHPTVGAIQRWRALPPLADTGLAGVLDQRFTQWMRAHTPARPAAPPVAPVVAPAAPKAPKAPKVRTLDAAQRERIDALLLQAETAVAEGQLSELQAHLQAVDSVIEHAGGAVPPDALRNRLLHLQAERARLNDWRQWGGGRAREDLADEAEALARATLAATEAAAPATGEAPTTDQATTATDGAPAAEPVEAPDTAGLADSPTDAPIDAPIDGLADDEAHTPADTAPLAEAEPSIDAAAPPADAPQALDAAPAADTAPAPADAIDAAPALAADATDGTAVSATAADAVPAARPPRAPKAPKVPPKAAKAPRAPQAPKLNLKAHADAIQALRQRWKALDRLGAAASQALWQRFDAALTIAYQPVAAQQAAMKAARQDNLRAREALLATLDAVPAEVPEGPAEAIGAHWKAVMRALDQFHTAWRQLGPIEHTAPAASREPLNARLRSSLERLELPLQSARRVAESQRERFIAQVEAMAAELGRGAAPRELPQRVRDLQAQWQQHARSLPLARGVEAALWTRFRAATDAAFAQREAVFNARDAELSAELAKAEALVARLAEVTDDTPAAEIQRTLAEVDRAWSQGGELPRAAAAGIEARYREARAAAQARLADEATRRWHAQCDALAARLALCEKRESSSDGADDLASQWAALPPLPEALAQPLVERWAAPAGAGPMAGDDVDQCLLQLEAALDVPAPPAWQAARRQLKLQGLKDALEGRAGGAPDPAVQQGRWMASLLRQAGTTEAQRERLRALLAALRQRPPGGASAPQAHGPRDPRGAREPREAREPRQGQREARSR